MGIHRSCCQLDCLNENGTSDESSWHWFSYLHSWFEYIWKFRSHPENLFNPGCNSSIQKKHVWNFMSVLCTKTKNGKLTWFKSKKIPGLIVISNMLPSGSKPFDTWKPANYFKIKLPNTGKWTYHGNWILSGSNCWWNKIILQPVLFPGVRNIFLMFLLQISIKHFFEIKELTLYSHKE